MTKIIWAGSMKQAQTRHLLKNQTDLTKITESILKLDDIILKGGIALELKKDNFLDLIGNATIYIRNAIFQRTLL